MKKYNRLFISVLLLLYSQSLLSCDSESGLSDNRTPFERVQQEGLRQPKKTWKERYKGFIKKLFEKRNDSGY